MTKLLCDVEGYRATLNNAMGVGIERFYRFYHETPQYTKGRKIFKTQFLPFVIKYVEECGVSLDIGYGAGGMVYAASKHFIHAMGLDVHDQAEIVAKELVARCRLNFTLHRGDGNTFPIDSGVIDFIHSWTVFMHLGKAERIRGYLAECHRVLKDGGVAVIYFARMADAKIEGNSYIEKGKKPVNLINIIVSMKWMVEEAKYAGFDVLEKMTSSIPVHHIENYYGQHGLVLRRR